MQPAIETLSQPSVLSLNWTKADIDEFLWGAKVLTLVGVHGFRKAAVDAFLEHGYRLATISRDNEPFVNMVKMSLYALDERKRLGRSEATKLAHCVMEKIGVRLNSDECYADTSGQRLIVSVCLPQWAARLGSHVAALDGV